MKLISKTLKLLPLLFVVFAFNACSDDDDNGTPSQPTLLNIFATAETSADLTNLVAALEEADLDVTLQGDGPFTVFAPTNDALAALLQDQGVSTLAELDDDLLENVLLNHVIGGQTIMSSDLISAGSGYENTFGEGADDENLSLYYNVNGSVVEINGGAANSTDINAGANVTTADIMATNGVVHIVNSVIMPPTVVDHALANPNLTSLVAALQEADGSDTDPMLIPTLSGDGPFTVFAPLNDAFAAFLDGAALPAVDDVTLNSVLLHHVINGNVTAAGLTDGASPETLEGDNITINLPGNDGNPAKITDGSGNTDIDVVLVDIQGTNGVVHAIESVLSPDTENDGDGEED